MAVGFKIRGDKRVNYSNEERKLEKSPLDSESEDKSEDKKFSNNSYEELILGPFL